jgi:DNA replication licensing factor MCM7
MLDHPLRCSVGAELVCALSRPRSSPSPPRSPAAHTRSPRRFEVRFRPLTSVSKPLALRSVRAADIGHLVSVKAICTRVSDVKPLVSVVTYACDVCGYEIYQNVRVWGWLGWLTTGWAD